MGVVYRATQLALQRPVALKAIAPRLAEDAAYRERFKRESQIAASIEHPNVIPVYEAGELDGTLYLIMRWVDGTDLRELLREHGQLPPERAVRLLRPVASALGAAHRRGLVHRDVKPANVLIARGESEEEEEEHVYLSDFGIARRADGEGAMTRTGVLVGTIDYLAPERIEGGSGTAASDIYAFGCMLFEALTGHIPFQGPTDLMRMHAHLNDPVPSARAEQPEVPERLDQLVARAMAKRPEDRFESAGALAAALGDALEESDTAATVAELPATELAIVAEPPTEFATGAVTEPAPSSPTPPPPTPPPSRAPRSRRVLAAPVVLIAAVAIAIALLAGGGGKSQALPTATGQPVTISKPIALPAGINPGATWADGSSVLVVTNNAVLRIGAGGQLGQFRLDGHPTDVAVDDSGRVWVTEAAPNQVVVFQGAGQKRIALSFAPTSISVSRSAAWIASVGSIITRVPVDTLRPENLTVPGSVAAIGEAYDRLWVALRDGTLRALDEAGRPTLPGPELPLETIAIAHTDGVWFLSSAGVLTRVDPRTNPPWPVNGHYRQHPDQFTIPNPIPSLAGLEQNHLIWVGSGSGRVIRVGTQGPGSNHAVTTIDFHAPPGYLAVAPGVLWVTIPSRNELYRVTFR